MNYWPLLRMTLDVTGRDRVMYATDYPPDWEPFGWTNGFRQIVISELPRNWLQAQENSIDPVHFEWMHMNWGRRQEMRRPSTAPGIWRLPSTNSTMA